MLSRLDLNLAACAAQGRAALVILRHRRRSDARLPRPDPRRAGRRRRRRDRARHAVHRSDGRWPRDPGGQPAQRSAPARRTADILAIANAFRGRHPDVPLVLMGYANPMVRRGPNGSPANAARRGVDGVICVDIPPEEDDAARPGAARGGRRLIRLATPDDRRQAAARRARRRVGLPLLCLGRRASPASSRPR